MLTARSLLLGEHGGFSAHSAAVSGLFTPEFSPYFSPFTLSGAPHNHHHFHHRRRSLLSPQPFPQFECTPRTPPRPITARPRTDHAAPRLPLAEPRYTFASDWPPVTTRQTRCEFCFPSLFLQQQQQQPALRRSLSTPGLGSLLLLIHRVHLLLLRRRSSSLFPHFHLALPRGQRSSHGPRHSDLRSQRAQSPQDEPGRTVCTCNSSEYLTNPTKLTLHKGKGRREDLRRRDASEDTSEDTRTQRQVRGKSRM
ncbi:hypothetical protein WMY93_033601 [Mugilogobius chulae]|uniref:Uncharacterized protein n=1 Tax=Mugilogobius chulae TaxID=88201 RepID=A0AAW0MN34_9GOBI